MSEFWQKIRDSTSWDQLTNWAVAFAVLVIGFVVASVARRGFRRLFSERLSAQQLMVGGKVIYYSLLAVAVAISLEVADFANLAPFLGAAGAAAGILTVALGFASQTSASNLISGLFLVGERAFEVGDVIRVGTTEGIVTTIDLLSVKLRTFDNVFVRIPNETLLKAEITNLTHFPIRRRDVIVGVAYKEDLKRVEEVLRETAAKNPYVLDEPKPIFFFKAFGNSSIDLQFSVWFTRETFFEGTNRFQQEVKAAFDEAGIEIPFPHVSVYTGSVTDPFPVRVIGDDSE